MKKTKKVFEFNYEKQILTNKFEKGSEWVIDDNISIPTVKFDGTATFYKDGIFYKRYDLKPKISKKEKLFRKKNGILYTWDDFPQKPENAIPCQENFDAVTGHFPMWVPVDFKSNENKYHLEAFENAKKAGILENETSYELIGEKINGNPHNIVGHKLIKHGSVIINNLSKPYNIDNIYKWLIDNNEEGIVFWNKETGELAKIRRKDIAIDTSYNFKWDKAEIKDFHNLEEIKNK